MSSNEQIVSEDFQNLFRVNKGMWIFIFIDFLLFAGFLGYHISSGMEFGNDFAFGRSQLLQSFGFINIIILLTSGLTMGLSKVAAFNKNNFLSIVFVFVTFVLAMIFISNRAIDCTYLFGKGFLFGADSFSELNNGLSTFFTSYFLIYFLFMIHLFVGVIMLVMLLLNLIKAEEQNNRFAKLNFTVIYWSYLTLVWVVIFPVLYLI